MSEEEEEESGMEETESSGSSSEDSDSGEGKQLVAEVLVCQRCNLEYYYRCFCEGCNQQQADK